jgi:cytochrome c-type biogenesis protein
VAGTPLTALGAAFVWGILSIILSPCHLASIPLIVGYVGERGRTSAKWAFLASSLFSVGILVTIGLVGTITAAAGRMLGDIGPYGNYLVAIIFFLVGLHLLGAVPAPWGGFGRMRTARKGLAGAFALGFLFGIALGPCTFAYMAPLLGVTFKLSSSNLPYGVLLLTAYGIGHCSVIVLAGTLTEVVQQYLDWNDRSRGTIILRKACGGLLLLGGVYLLYAA